MRKGVVTAQNLLRKARKENVFVSDEPDCYLFMLLLCVKRNMQRRIREHYNVFYGEMQELKLSYPAVS